ncbi:MAG TPA: hypothetical protein VF266_28085 [Thermoanaerobaculia bacterium]
MSTKEKDVVVSTNATTNTTTSPHVEMAQARLQELRQSRAQIPNFTLPLSGKETQKLNSAASVSPQFVEVGASAMANERVLQRADITPEEIRDLMAYAEAYGPLIDEYEAMGQFLRHSVTAARHRAGSETLATYHNAKRLAKIPRYAGLAVYVADMRRALGKARGKETPEQAEKRATKLLAKVRKVTEQAAAKPQAPDDIQ